MEADKSSMEMLPEPTSLSGTSLSMVVDVTVYIVAGMEEVPGQSYPVPVEPKIDMKLDLEE